MQSFIFNCSVGNHFNFYCYLLNIINIIVVYLQLHKHIHANYWNYQLITISINSPIQKIRNLGDKTLPLSSSPSPNSGFCYFFYFITIFKKFLVVAIRTLRFIDLYFFLLICQNHASSIDFTV